MTRAEITAVQAHLRKLSGNDRIVLVPPGISAGVSTEHWPQDALADR
jgi:hypothetical protein